MRKFNYKKAIKEIKEKSLYIYTDSKVISEKEVINIINNNIEEDGLESYEQLDHYCKQWQERYNDLLDKYLKLSDKYFDLYNAKRMNIKHDRSRKQ